MASASGISGVKHSFPAATSRELLFPHAKCLQWCSNCVPLKIVSRHVPSVLPLCRRLLWVYPYINSISIPHGLAETWRASDHIGAQPAPSRPSG